MTNKILLLGSGELGKELIIALQIMGVSLVYDNNINTDMDLLRKKAKAQADKVTVV